MLADPTQIYSTTAGPSTEHHFQINPDLITGMTINPAAPPLGSTFTATLTNNPSPTYFPISTTWSYSVSYGGFTSPTVNVAGSLLSSSLFASVPGTYTITAVTTYQTTNPTDSPPPPTTTTTTVTIPIPNTVTKGGAVGTPAPPNSAIQIVDTVYAGGVQVGSMAAGMVQENILPFTWWDGTPGGGGGWGPAAPSFQFSFWGGQIHDQFMFSPPLGVWAGIPVGTTLCSFTQELQYVWSMSTTTAGDQTFTVPLTTLSWTWTKVDANDWEAN